MGGVDPGWARGLADPGLIAGTPLACALVKLRSTWVRVPPAELVCSRRKTMSTPPP